MPSPPVGWGPSYAVTYGTIDDLLSIPHEQNYTREGLRDEIEGSYTAWAQTLVEAGAVANAEGIIRIWEAVTKDIFEDHGPVFEWFSFVGAEGPGVTNGVGMDLWELMSYSRGS